MTTVVPLSTVDSLCVEENYYEFRSGTPPPLGESEDSDGDSEDGSVSNFLGYMGADGTFVYEDASESEDIDEVPTECKFMFLNTLILLLFI